MAVDVSTIALAIDSTGVVKAKGDLDAMVPSAAKVEQVGNDVTKAFDRMGVSIASMSNSSTRARSDMSDAAAKYIAALEKEIATFGATRAEIERIEAASLGFSKTERDKAAALGAAIDAMHRQEDAAKALAAQQDRNAVASAAFIARLQEQTAVQGLSKAELLAYQAAQLGITKEAAPLIAGLGEAGKEMEHFGFRTARSKTELLVLAHELSQGNYKRFGGSLMVLGEQTGIMGLAFSAAGAAVLGTVAIFGAFTYELIRGYIEQEHFNKSLALTGNFAGQTNDSIAMLSKTLSQSTNTTIGAARDVTMALVATGEVGPRLIGPLGDSILRVQALTGEATGKIVADYAKLAEAPTKWALEHNKAMNFVTVSMFEHIRLLEETGHKEEAALIASKAMTDHLSGENAPALGTINTLLKGTNQDLSKFVEWMRAIGRETTMEERLTKINAALASIQERRANDRNLDPRRAAGRDAREEELGHERTAVLYEQAGKARQAYYKAEDAQTQKDGILASQHLKQIDDRARGVDKLKVALDALKTAEDNEIKAQRNAGNVNFAIDPATHAKRVAELERENKPRGVKIDHSVQKLETAFDSRLQSLTAEGIKLDAEVKNYELYGRAINNTRLAILDLDIATGKLHGLTPEKIKQLQDVAKADDSKAYALKQQEAAAAADKRTHAIEAAAKAEAMNSREVKIANELAAIEASGLVKGTALYEDAAAKRIKALNAEADANLKRKLAAEQMNVDNEVDKIDQQTAALGMNSLALQQAATSSKLYAQAQVDIAANPGQTAQILDAMVRKTNELTAAEQRRYDVRRSFDAGVATSLTKYQDAAANTAAFTEKFIDGSFSKMEDAIVNFTKTGKLNLGSLFQFMADEFIRQQARIMIAQATSGGANGGGLGGIIGSLASSYFAGNSGAATGVANALPGNSLDNLIGVTGGDGTIPGKASGGPVSAGGMYLVGEKGPELLRMGNQSGNITPNDKMGGGDTYVTVNNNTSTKATTSESTRPNGDRDIVVMIDEVVAGHINSGGGKTHDAIQRRFQLNPGGSTPRY